MPTQQTAEKVEPTCAVRSTWVPPQSSMEAPGTSTTRTAASLYFSPNIAMAPARIRLDHISSALPQRADQLLTLTSQAPLTERDPVCAALVLYHKVALGSMLQSCCQTWHRSLPRYGLGDMCALSTGSRGGPFL